MARGTLGLVLASAVLPALAGCAFLAGRATPANQENRPATPQDRQLQATWLRVSAEVGGQQAAKPGAGSSPDRLVITADSFDLQGAGQDVRHGSYTVDPGQGPKTIEVQTEVPAVVSGGGVIDIHRETVPGIYKIEGDTLTLCLDLFAVGRPTRFCSTAGPDCSYALFVYRRAAP
jgi:uncharacterized protein (TIGR03067 family)